MKKALVFGGTKDGRELAQVLVKHKIETHICVATAYGQEVLATIPEAVVHQGRLTGEEMETFIQAEGFHWIIDATHPFAREASLAIKKACAQCNMEYLRLLRETKETESVTEEIHSVAGYEGFQSYCVKDAHEAVICLNRGKGNVLLTTGSKELEIYTSGINDKKRIFARILAEPEAIKHCQQLGLTGKQIIGMQGPFSAELNYAMLKQVGAEYLVTKETGRTGGFPEKVKAAARAGTKVCIIKRPVEEGYAWDELLKKIGIVDGESLSVKEITLLGIGMGSLDGMTREGFKRCEDADIILGASRLLETLACLHRPSKMLYKGEEIVDFIIGNEQYSKILIALSGDIGFYSGAAKIMTGLKNSTLSYRLHLECGISSVAYFSSRLRIPWEDIYLMSLHGREQNLIGAVRKNEKVFTLTNGAAGVRRIARELMAYHMPDITMHVGNRLGYAEESIDTEAPGCFTSYEKEGLCVVLLVNATAGELPVGHGLADDFFIRGKAPMTKEEIRTISISKLKLTKASVVYDIGAGTGSVAIECALMVPEGIVYAIEQKEAAQELLRANKYRCQVQNLVLINGSAPDVLRELPPPSHVFIGGSSGRLKQIIEALLKKNKKIRIVVNAITLETVADIMALANPMLSVDVIQVAVSRSKVTAGYHMMMGQNPVYIITLEGIG